MQGHVYKIEKGLVYVKQENGERTWFEALGGYVIEIGDVISGNLKNLAGEDLYNITRDQTISVFIEGHT
jgi:hypothetical protein